MKSRVNGSSEAYKAFLPTFNKFNNQEAFVAVALNAKAEMQGKPWLVALGTATRVDVHPRDIFREAVKRNAVSVIVAHNHPSGDLEPSADDIGLTRRLEKAGEVLGIPLLDHLIVGKDKYCSMADRGMI
jgi:DNA repair protein RadC